MVAKRKKKTRIPQENLGTPSRWRLQHGDFTEPVREADPETGVPVLHRRAIDTLGQMLANGTITQEMHDAGAIFRRQFRAAALDGLRGAALVRLPAATGETMTERQVQARRQVAAALDVLGGPGGAAGSCVWHVVGLECSVREWAMRQGWGGRSVPASQAQGMLVGALSVLAAHYGVTPANVPSTRRETGLGRSENTL
jgi:hypothetical protein